MQLQYLDDPAPILVYTGADIWYWVQVLSYRYYWAPAAGAGATPTSTSAIWKMWPWTWITFQFLIIQYETVQRSVFHYLRCSHHRLDICYATNSFLSDRRIGEKHEKLKTEFTLTTRNKTLFPAVFESAFVVTTKTFKRDRMEVGGLSDSQIEKQM